MNILEIEKLKLETCDRVRIYLSHITCHDIEVREGIVTNPKSHKRGAYGFKESALQLKVEKAGIVRFGKPDFEHRKSIAENPYCRSFLYSKIIKIEEIS